MVWKPLFFFLKIVRLARLRFKYTCTYQKESTPSACRRPSKQRKSLEGKGQRKLAPSCVDRPLQDLLDGPQAAGVLRCWWRGLSASLLLQVFRGFGGLVGRAGF